MTERILLVSRDTYNVSVQCKTENFLHFLHFNWGVYIYVCFTQVGWLRRSSIAAFLAQPEISWADTRFTHNSRPPPPRKTSSTRYTLPSWPSKKEQIKKSR